ncbi:Major Facilitator Superfamily protein [Pilibacter termitis]|uniref:Major Facilitator Superfamily protein n=1 Tax=Pilibacter termitis TaxID=263852 RepID=A0A1T4LYZ0_9ENTE|nr:MFS transporter [Pilibacter termitis]SJZ59684.1 Major Facilitator Superfamily protein [Pilibacter termitis]
MKNLYKFVLSIILSATGDWFRTVLLITTLSVLTKNPSVISFFFILSILPSIILTPIISPISRYIKKKRLLIFCDIVRLFISLLFIIAISEKNISFLFLLIFVNGCFSAISTPTKTAFLPLIISEEDLVKGNSLMATSQSGIMLISTALGGVATNYLSAPIILLIDAFSFFLAILLVFSIDIIEDVENDKSGKSYLNLLSENFLVVKETRNLKMAIAYSSLREFIAGFVYVFFSYKILQLLQMGSVGLSYGYIASGIGQILGAYLMTKYLKNRISDSSLTKVLPFFILSLLLLHDSSYMVVYPIAFFILNFFSNIFYNPIGIIINVIITKSTTGTERSGIFFLNHFFSMIAYLLGFITVGLLFLITDYKMILLIVSSISVLLLIGIHSLQGEEIK